MDDKKLNEYLNRQDIVIEGTSATWDCNVNGEIQGTYTGQFRFRCFLTPTQRLAAGREHRELLGSNPTVATAHDDNLAFSLSQLRHRILSAPPFWSAAMQLTGMPGDIPDDNVIDVILEAAIASELKYRAQLKQKKVDSIKRAREAAERMLQRRDEEVNEGENQKDDDQS